MLGLRLMAKKGLDAYYRSKSEHEELLWFNKVTKEGCSDYCISSVAIIKGNKDCRYPTLTKVGTDDSTSYMKPLEEAFRKRSEV